MRFTKSLAGIFVILQLLVLFSGCGGGGGDGGNNIAPATPTLVSITVTPDNSSVAAGGSNQFTATATYSDNTTANVTGSANWSSQPASVATVGDTAGAKGLLTGVAAGTATLSAAIGNVSGSTIVTVTGGGAVAANVMAVTVNGALCSPGSYINKPCVSVTVCKPDNSGCVVVSDILLDTGSYGLRIFKDTLQGLALTQAASGAGSLAQCVEFADGSSLWGPVQIARVQMGSEPAVQVPIQVVDAAFGTRSQNCSNAEASRQIAGFNGILGVGVAAQDCGPACVNNAGIGIYYSCSGATCSGAAVPLANQVQNPVAHLPLDNNGVIIQLPSVPLGGASSIDGSVIFGIGTRANNIPGALTVIPTDSSGDFTTTYNGQNVDSFLDTGSNGLFFPNLFPLLPLCSAPNSAWYCPPATRSLSATMIGVGGAPSRTAQFQIGNLVTLASGPNNVFREAGGPSTFGFDWGLPFFMGRSVFIGFDDKASILGTGPYVAY